MSEHTPGPWKAWSAVVKSHTGAVSESPAWHVYGPSGSHLFVTIGYEHHDAHVEADARLIAAAPEMLEALLTQRTNFLTFADMLRLFTPDLALTAEQIAEDLRVVIAKATGQATVNAEGETR